jgi:hypothetical protein
MLLSDNLFVQRNVEQKKTVVTARYDIHINFWPNFTYVWNVEDVVEAYLF